MRRWLRRIWEDWTYMDLSGRRRMRRAAKAGLALLLAMIPLGVLALYQRARMMAVVHATPAPLLLPTRTPTPVPAPTPTRPVDESGCPADPQDWKLVNPTPQEPRRWLRIEPDCVYRGLARSVAAVMLLDMGWTWPEAQEALRLPRFPVRYHPVITVTGELDPGNAPAFYTVPQRGLPSGVVCSSDGCPRFWALKRGSAAPELPFYFFLRGCFRTRDLAGGKVRDWGMPYPVVCVVSQDVTPHDWIGISPDGGERFRHEYEDTWARSDNFFGYDPALRMWVQIGSEEQEGEAVARAVRENGREFARFHAGLHGQPVWDGRWLEETFRLTMKPLPEGWRRWPDQMAAFYQRRGADLERAMQEWSR